LDLLIAQKGAVERAQIANFQQPLDFKQLTVLATDHGMSNRQVGFSASPDDRGKFQGNLALVGLTFGDH
jgi:hypothetical protein